MNPIDKFRLEVLQHLSNTNSFKKSWENFSTEINNHVSSQPTAAEIFLLGEYLSKVFSSNSVSGRSQSAVSGGGTAWECLVAWYLNSIFWGTNIIATRQNNSFVPKVVKDSLTVTISNHQTNTESDIVIYSVPNITNQESLNLNQINDLISNNTKDTDLSVVQCKTNWNDNSQIPMLWDLIYNSQSFRIPNVSIGINGVSPASFGKFTYAFVTVPTVRSDPRSHQVAVLRVKNLTGGNYWGKISTAGVSSCINNFFGNNFGIHFVGGVQSHIAKQLNSDPSYYKRFRDLSFS